MKTIINYSIGAMLLFGISTAAFALRCGNVLITEGANLYQVENACPIESIYTVANENADIKKVYTKEGSMTHELIFVDGKLQTINSSRF